ncbi:MAG: DUF4232 domain-containing protein [Polyangiaceae bacterium]
MTTRLGGGFSGLIFAFGFAASAGCGSGNSNSVPAPPVTATIDTTDASAPAPPTSAAPIVDAGSTTPTASAEDAMCGGADIDLAAVLANKKCRPTRDAPPTPASAASDLKISLTPSSTKIAPGGHVDLVLEITNGGQAAIPLYFSGDLMLAAQVKDAKGTRISPPAGNAPKNADPKCADKDCRLPESHVLLAPGAKAHAKIGFDAVKMGWPATGPTTCCTIHVDPVAKGSLAVGTYKVKVPLPYESNQGNPADPEVAIQVAK